MLDRWKQQAKGENYRPVIEPCNDQKTHLVKILNLKKGSFFSFTKRKITFCTILVDLASIWHYKEFGLDLNSHYIVGLFLMPYYWGL